MASLLLALASLLLALDSTECQHVIAGGGLAPPAGGGGSLAGPAGGGGSPAGRPGAGGGSLAGGRAAGADRAGRPAHSSSLNAEMNASCGTSTRPMLFMRFFPSRWRSMSLRFRVMSPP